MTGATEELHRTHIGNLRSALELAGDQLPGDLVAECEHMLGAIQERLDLGVDYTIVALGGGTGSGKSSTFNALSGLDFADVGVRRPTTARVNSCSWSAHATRLLDWLGVDADRRITRDTILDVRQDQDLDGLILLDLPDHDSVVTAHKDVVDAILPLVDLLIWVVDPQKYADQALHAGYLRKLVDAQASMVVAINQIDKVPPHAQDLLIVDVEQMLIADGLDQVVVRAISAHTGQGIDELRSELTDAVARQSMASTRMRDELARLGSVILRQVPGSVLTDPESLIDQEVTKLEVASGVRAVQDQVSALQTTKLWQEKPPTFQVPGLSQLGSLREQWVRKVSANMTEPWAVLIEQAVLPAPEILEITAQEMRSVHVPWWQETRVRRFNQFALGAAIVSLIFVAVIVGQLTSLLPTRFMVVAIIGAVVAAAAALWLRSAGIKAARQWGQTQAQVVAADARQAMSRALNTAYVDPVRPILDRHEAVRKLAHQVANSR